MEKMQKTAKTIDTILKILFWIILIAGVIALIVDAVLLAGGTGFIANSANGYITVNGMRLDLADNPQLLPQFGSIMKVSVTAAIISIAFAVIGLIMLRKIIKPMKSGQPFVGSVSTSFKRLGWLVVIYGVVSNILGFVATSVSNEAAVELVQQGVVSGNTVTSFSLQLTPFIAALFVFLFSYIFAYGEELQKKADETLIDSDSIQ